MNKVDLSIFKNPPQVGAGKFKIILWYFTNVLFLKNGWNPSSTLKKNLLKLFGSKVGKGVIIKPGVNIKYPWKLKIGDYVWIGENVWIDNIADITLGSNVCLSQGCMLMCGNHNYKRKDFPTIASPIIVEDGAWIGARSLVTGGVTVHTHAILNVMSVASQSLEAYGIYRGNPAVKIKTRTIDV